MSEESQPSAGTTTLLFTDIEGSTKLIQQLGDRYAIVLGDHHRLLRDAFAGHGGTELDSAGDGLYYKFPSARAAVAAAVDGQRPLFAHTWPDGAHVRVRMGLHTGEPVKSESQVVLIAYPAIEKGKSLRLRISEIYTEAVRYASEQLAPNALKAA